MVIFDVVRYGASEVLMSPYRLTSVGRTVIASGCDCEDDLVWLEAGIEEGLDLCAGRLVGSRTVATISESRELIEGEVEAKGATADRELGSPRDLEGTTVFVEAVEIEEEEEEDVAGE